MSNQHDNALGRLAAAKAQLDIVHKDIDFAVEHLNNHPNWVRREAYDAQHAEEIMDYKMLQTTLHDHRTALEHMQANIDTLCKQRNSAVVERDEACARQATLRDQRDKAQTERNALTKLLEVLLDQLTRGDWKDDHGHSVQLLRAFTYAQAWLERHKLPEPDDKTDWHAVCEHLKSKAYDEGLVVPEPKCKTGHKAGHVEVHTVRPGETLAEAFERVTKGLPIK